MAGRLNPVLRWAAGVLLLAALVWWVQRSVGWAEVFAAWGRLSASELALVTLLTFVGYIARAARLVAHFGGALKTEPLLTFRVMALHNLANNFLPMRTGELSFPILLRREFQIDAARSVGALLWLRALDLSAILVAAALSLGIDRLGLGVGLALGVAGLVLPAVGFRLLKLHQPEGEGMLARLAAGLPVSTASLLAGHLLTLLHWGAKLAAWAWLLGRLGHIDRVLAWTGAVAGELTSVLPVHGIAGAGTYEAGIVLVLRPLGVPVDDALMAATDLHLFLLGFALLTGLLAWLFIRR
ncbi:UPF0104 family protein [bacterium]|nr:MAG: UPF0104 family protein [bacterium]RKZ17311.1 MAG: UPF0104 family protein [bacterium]